MNVHTIWVADHVALSTIPHAHDYYQIVYCKKASGSFEIGGRRYLAVPGHAYFIQPMEPHAMRQDDSMRIVELKFLVRDEKSVQRLKQVPSEFALEDDLTLRLSLKEVVKEGLSQAPYSSESTNAALALLLIRILRKFVEDTSRSIQAFYFDVPDESPDPAGRSSDVQLAKLIDYIEKHLAQPITLDDLVEQVHFNKSYLVERFKSIWGVPPMKYVNWLRVDRAKELLVTTDKSVTDIAQETGFQSIHYFSRYFKEKEQMTPQSYRLRYAGELRAPAALPPETAE